MKKGAQEKRDEVYCLLLSLLPVGSLAVLNVQVEKIEDQKLYMSCIAQSRDQQTVFAKSSGKEVLSLSPSPEQMEGRKNAKDLAPSGAQLFKGWDFARARDMDEGREDSTRTFC